MGGNVSRLGNIFPDVAVKAPVRIATLSTAPPIAHSGLQSIDGVALAEGDRVLDKDQIDQTLNGIWQASSGNWIRANDASKNTDFVDGTFVVASEGTVQAGQMFMLQTTDNPVIVGSSLLVFKLRQEIVNSPAFEWSGTSLRFRNPDGTWGAFVDLLGPIGPANNTMFFDTVAQLIGATIPAGITHVFLFGYASADDGGAKNMISVGSIPGGADPNLYHTSNGGTKFWQLQEPSVALRMLGAKGDGVNNDLPFFQSASDYLGTSFPGGTLNGRPGDIYRFVINAGTTNLGAVLRNNVNAVGNGAAINFECDSHVYGLRPLGKNKITGWAFKTTSSTGLSSTPGAEQAIWHANIALGCAYGLGGTVASPDPFCAPSDVEIYGNSFDSVRNNGQGGLIQGFGGGDNIKIHDNDFAPNGNATIAYAIGFDWLPQGAIDETNYNATKAAYLANPRTAQTLHWTRLQVRNNRIGHLTMPATTSGIPAVPIFGSHGVRLSGVVSYDVRDNDIAETTYCGVFITGGDLALEYADATLRYMAFRNCFVSGNTMRRSNSGYDVRIDCAPDNLYDAFSNPANPQYPYSPIYLVTYPTDVVIENNFGNGNGATTALEGILLGNMIGGTVRGNTVQFHKNGIRVADLASAVKIVDGNDVSNNREAGILVQGSGVQPQGVVIERNRSYQNCQSGAGSTGNICADTAIDTIIAENEVGAGDTTSDGIYSTANATRTTIRGNRILGIKVGGSALKLAQPQTTVFEVSANPFLGSGTYISGLDIIPVRREASTANTTGFITEYVAKKSAMSGGVPTFGTYFAGDRIWIEDAINTGDIALVKCSLAGTVGSWKTLITCP